MKCHFCDQKAEPEGRALHVPTESGSVRKLPVCWDHYQGNKSPKPLTKIERRIT